MPVDMLGRRSRFNRTPCGKRLVLGDRDMEILRWLYRYRYLRQPQLVDLLKPKSPKRLIERFGDLFHETKLINRPPAQWRHCDPRCTPLIYEITKSGIELLEQQCELPHRATTLTRRVQRGTSPQFEHAMMIVDTLVSIELENIDIPNQRFVPIDEILARAPKATDNPPNPLSVPVTIKPGVGFNNHRSPIKTHIIPDGLYGIEYLIDGEKRYRFWALECERTSPKRRSATNKSSLSLKQAAYMALVDSKQYKQYWGIPNLKLHVVASR